VSARRAVRVKFTATRAERELIQLIADRATAIRAKHKIESDIVATKMDLEATHCNGCRLDFRRLLAADDFNLSHDVFGIERHLNRSTGRLEHCFLPRFHEREPATRRAVRS
jgi:hypothetical protein